MLNTFYNLVSKGTFPKDWLLMKITTNQFVPYLIMIATNGLNILNYLYLFILNIDLLLLFIMFLCIVEVAENKNRNSFSILLF